MGLCFLSVFPNLPLPLQSTWLTWLDESLWNAFISLSWAKPPFLPTEEDQMLWLYFKSPGFPLIPKYHPHLPNKPSVSPCLTYAMLSPASTFAPTVTPSGTPLCAAVSMQSLPVLQGLMAWEAASDPCSCSSEPLVRALNCIIHIHLLLLWCVIKLIACATNFRLLCYNWCMLMSAEFFNSSGERAIP